MANKSKAPVKESEKAADAPSEQSGSKGSFRRVTITIGLIIAIVIFAVVALFTTLAVISNRSNLRAAREEYDFLREFAGEIESESGGTGTAQLSALDIEMRQINPDYVCWIRIDGTNIDYPVVRGQDNEKYLHTSFYGEESDAGAIFMDYRNVGEYLRHTIIYGHNLIQGGMFTDLRKFLTGSFMQENNIITLIVNDNEIKFEIFSARLSDIHDPAYNLDLGTPRDFARFADRINAPLTADQILTLSTCTSNRGDDARIIVQAHRLTD